MSFSAKQLFNLSRYAIAAMLIDASLATRERPASPLTLATLRHHRRHPSLAEQEPPSWLAAVVRAALVLALAALGFASLLGCSHRSP